MGRRKVYDDQPESVEIHATWPGTIGQFGMVGLGRLANTSRSRLDNLASIHH